MIDSYCFGLHTVVPQSLVPTDLTHFLMIGQFFSALVSPHVRLTVQYIHPTVPVLASPAQRIRHCDAMINNPTGMDLITSCCPRLFPLCGQRSSRASELLQLNSLPVMGLVSSWLASACERDACGEILGVFCTYLAHQLRL
jgi:hypothetical protein